MTTEQLYSFYRSLDGTVPKTTVNWRVYELVKKGILKRVGKGRFEWGNEAAFNPEISIELKEISKGIRKQFPFISYCIWDSGMINPFHHHLTWSKFVLIDVEKEVMEAVFNFLWNEHKSIYLKPVKEIIDRYIMRDHDSIIVRQLISESPIQTINNVPTLTIEKMIVDLFSDDEFEYLRDRELQLICRNIFDRYTVNKSKLTRYAGRKGKQEKILKFLEDNNLIKSAST